jgi:hypothetical protein
LADRERRGGFDLEALEFLTRTAMHRIGAGVLGGLLSLEDGGVVGPECECGGRFINQRRSGKELRTILGEVRLLRMTQRCNGCGGWRSPVDVVLGVEGTGFSPGLRRLMSKAGAESCFDRARDFLFDMAGVRVTDKEVERVSEGVGAEILAREEEKTAAVLSGAAAASEEAPEILYLSADGTGVPALKRETEGRRGKAADGVARSREAKLGAVFTQTAVDEEGRPVRDPGSTTYVGKIEGVEEFGGRLYAEAVRRGLNRAGQVVMLGDGAPWVWNLADLHFPGAVQIVDFYHAAEHLSGIASLLYPEDEPARTAWFGRARKRLKKGKVLELIAELKGSGLGGRKKGELEKALAYFEKNQKRMRYDLFRRQGFFIGSGVVEAGCKSLIGKRLKQSGMHWSVRGANSIIALRCCLESRGFEEYWEERRAA